MTIQDDNGNSPFGLKDWQTEWVAKEDAECVYTDDPYYDIIHGGYIKPEEFVPADQATKVYDAIATLESFLDFLYAEGLLENQ